MAALNLSPDLVDDSRFWPLLKTAVECLAAELDAAKGPARCFTGLMVGDQATPLGVATTCNSGVAWVRPVQVFPSSTFPQPAEFAACNAPLAMLVEMGVARPAPRAEGRSMQPDPQDTFDAVRLYMSDLRAMDRAICCVGKAAGREFEFARASWDPLPQGAGLSGGTWNFVIG